MSKHSYAHTSHLEQGEGGGNQYKTSGGPRDPKGEGGAGKQKAPPVQKGGKLKARVITRSGSAPGSGDHLQPFPPGSNKTAVRGGGGVTGHDRVNPNAGKPSSDDKMTQQPGLRNASKKQKVINPYTPK